ncbi:MAG: hypothetical protein JJ902_05180 [Roseibium sp.]|nr:hypothetical protein [Roseibium sp.]
MSDHIRDALKIGGSKPKGLAPDPAGGTPRLAAHAQETSAAIHQTRNQAIDLDRTLLDIATLRRREIRDIDVDIQTKQREIAQAETEHAALVERREILARELAGTQAALVALNQD